MPSIYVLIVWCLLSGPLYSSILPSITTIICGTDSGLYLDFHICVSNDKSFEVFISTNLMGVSSRTKEGLLSNVNFTFLFSKFN